MKRVRLGTAMFAVWGLMAACAPDVRELGDDAKGGGAAGQSTGGGIGLAGEGPASTPGGGGSGGIAHTGGTTHSGGAPDTPGLAGEGPGPTPECFSPTLNPQLGLEEGAVGCACQETDPVCVSDLQANPPWIGMLLCEDGHWKSVPPSCDTACFAPDRLPELAIDFPDAGCACTGDEPPECVLTEHQGRPWRVSLYCERGRWISAEDGVCGDGFQTDCRVDGVTYPHGARGVPDPFGCGLCSCNDGALEECSDTDCVPTSCPEGSFPAHRCLGCGPADQCTEEEIGCLSGEGCETGRCDSPWCG